MFWKNSGLAASAPVGILEKWPASEKALLRLYEFVQMHTFEPPALAKVMHGVPSHWPGHHPAPEGNAVKDSGSRHERWRHSTGIDARDREVDSSISTEGLALRLADHRTAGCGGGS